MGYDLQMLNWHHPWWYIPRGGGGEEEVSCRGSALGVLLETARVFLMTFIIVVKSYMEVSSETSD